MKLVQHGIPLVFILSVLAARTGTAHAQSTASVSAPPTAAEQLITVGIGLRQHGDDAGALRVFQQAYQISPSPRALGQIALAEQALERWLDAEAHMREVLAQVGDAWVRRSRTVLESAYQEIRIRVAELIVDGATSGDVVLNGDIVSVLPMQNSIRVLAGECTLEVRAPGFSSETRRMFLPGGEVTRIVVELRPMIVGAQGITTPTPPQTPPRDAQPGSRDHTVSHWLGYGGIALGLGAFGFGAVMTANVFGSADTLNGDLCQQARDGWIRPEENCPGAQSSFDAALTGQWVGYGLGAALLGVGIGILLVDAEGSQERRATDGVSVSCATFGSGGSCSVRF